MGLFYNGEQIELLKSIETLLATINSNSKNTEVFSDEEMRQAAYALNLCMVSVSQIIDYNDIYILEQEYDAILNNLNLEMMPKDEALLDILKQLLNTITFFRIQEGDKKFIEREYQQKMKNAIWSAVPNFAVIANGGTPLSIAVSLASQVGIGYMNYRRTKAENQLAHEKEMWQLQRSAMEQFNGLRRELFDTAWRLADKYNFPDEYRITESQITRYNEILMDSDYLRRYERLDYISDKFEAYPPFWYYLGNAANAIAQNPLYDDAIRTTYHELAVQHFEKFLTHTERNLLREDKIRASCALEYFDLLIDEGADRAKLNGLIDTAIEAAGNVYDVLELCGIAYMRLGNYQKASSILRMLVNEEYNKTVNAQLLSCIYVSTYIEHASISVKHDYLTLTTRVNANFLFPLPNKPVSSEAEKVELQRAFIDHQRSVLLEQYGMALKELVAKYAVEFENSIPAPNPKERLASAYYEDSVTARQKKYEGICSLIKDEDKKRGYLFDLDDFADKMFSVLNDFYATIRELPGIQDDDIIYYAIKGAIEKNSESLKMIQHKIEDKSLEGEDIRILSMLDFMCFTKEALLQTIKQIKRCISELQDMSGVSHIEGELQKFCIDHGFSMLEIGVTSNTPVEPAAIKTSYFDTTLLCDTQAEKQRVDMKRDMLRCAKSYENQLISKGKMTSFYLYGSEEFLAYCKRHEEELGEKRDILAIINDTSPIDEDWIFTLDGLQRFGRILRFNILKKSLDGPFPYDCIRKLVSGKKIKLVLDEDDKVILDNSNLDLEKVFDLITELAKLSNQYQNKGDWTKHLKGSSSDSVEKWVLRQLIDVPASNKTSVLSD